MTRALLGTVAAVLVGGQTQWFLPARLHTGDVVRCVDDGRHLDAKVPAPPPPGSAEFGWDALEGALKMQIARRPNGSTQVTCGDVAAPGPRRPALPYVIGQNGLALIRGANTLAKLRTAYGTPTATQPATGMCLAAWERIGLRARFRGNSCDPSSVLAGASVAGARWSSLSGAFAGDSVARMVFDVPQAKRVRGRWRLSARLYALVAGGRVTGFAIGVSPPASTK